MPGVPVSGGAVALGNEPCCAEPTLAAVSHSTTASRAHEGFGSFCTMGSSWAKLSDDVTQLRRGRLTIKSRSQGQERLCHFRPAGCSRPGKVARLSAQARTGWMELDIASRIAALATLLLLLR